MGGLPHFVVVLSPDMGEGVVSRTNDRGSVIPNNRLSVERIDKMNRNNRLAVQRIEVPKGVGAPKGGACFRNHKV